jgi:hypothetical protein
LAHLAGGFQAVVIANDIALRDGALLQTKFR